MRFFILIYTAISTYFYLIKYNYKGGSWTEIIYFSLIFFRISGSGVKEFCSHSTKVECMKFNESQDPCEKLHFAKILQPHTDESLGDCSFLNTCFHMDTCKYIHYEVDAEDIRKQRSNYL